MLHATVVTGSGQQGSSLPPAEPAQSSPQHHMLPLWPPLSCCDPRLLLCQPDAAALLASGPTAPFISLQALLEMKVVAFPR